MDDRITVYVDAKDNRVHDSQTCPTLSPARRGKLQEWGRLSRSRLEAREFVGWGYEPCSFCFPVRVDVDDEQASTDQSAPKACPECGVTMARRRLGLKDDGPLVWECLNCGVVAY